MIANFPWSIRWYVSDSPLVKVDRHQSPVGACPPLVQAPLGCRRSLGECLDGEVLEKGAVESDKAVANVAVVDKMNLGVVRQGMVKLMP